MPSSTSRRTTSRRQDDADLLDTKPAAKTSSPSSTTTSRTTAATATATAAPPTSALLALTQEVQISIYTYLRATDLSSLQRVSRHFNDRSLINAIIGHTAEHVYPPDLTQGFDTPEVGGPVNTQTGAGGTGPDFLTYEMLRNMEMLVVARVLSRPEPPLGEREQGFYVSRSWCRTALRWLEVQQEEQREAAKRRNMSTSAAAAASSSSTSRNPHASKKKKKTRKDKKQERIRNRKNSNALPPWQNINDDILCPHGDLARCSSKSTRARRRIMDKQAWKVLNKLYPDSVQLSSVQSECLQCIMELETSRKNEADKKEKEKEERRRPLSCSIVRGIYTRSKGVPASCLACNVEEEAAAGANNCLDCKVPAKPVAHISSRDLHCPGTCSRNNQQCPLIPGVYNALPRSWCHRWRKFLKTGDGERPVAPDATALLCDAHRVPLIPPHLEAFLYGDTPTLLVGSGITAYFPDDVDAPLTNPPAPSAAAAAASSPYHAIPVGLNPVRRTSSEDGVDDGGEDGVTEEEEAIVTALRAAGLSESEVQAQRLAMMNLERQSHMAAAASSPAPHSLREQGSFNRQSSIGTINTPDTPAAAAASAAANIGSSNRESINEQLDRENYRVVEILTDEEFTALEKWWPDISVNYALRFAVTEDDGGKRSIVWSTAPCQECDASGKNCHEFAGRMQRARRIRRNGTVPNGKGR